MDDEAQIRLMREALEDIATPFVADKLPTAADIKRLQLVARDVLEYVTHDNL